MPFSHPSTHISMRCWLGLFSRYETQTIFLWGQSGCTSTILPCIERYNRALYGKLAKPQRLYNSISACIGSIIHQRSFLPSCFHMKEKKTLNSLVFLVPCPFLLHITIFKLCKRSAALTEVLEHERRSAAFIQQEYFFSFLLAQLVLLGVLVVRNTNMEKRPMETGFSSIVLSSWNDKLEIKWR